MAADTTSEADICNEALDNIGHSAVIADLNEGSDEANTCLRHYAKERDRLLRAFPWPFATVRVSPAALDATALAAGAVPSPWSFAYAYPADCLQLRRIIWLPPGLPTTIGWWWPDCGWGRDERFGWERMQNIPHAIERDATLQAKVILTDAGQALDPPTLIYTASVQDPNEFAADFTEALSWKLAAKLALAIRKDTKMAADMGKVFQSTFDMAVSNARGESPLQPFPEAPHIRARR